MSKVSLFTRYLWKQADFSVRSTFPANAVVNQSFTCICVIPGNNEKLTNSHQRRCAIMRYINRLFTYFFYLLTLHLGVGYSIYVFLEMHIVVGETGRRTKPQHVRRHIRDRTFPPPPKTTTEWNRSNRIDGLLRKTFRRGFCCKTFSIDELISAVDNKYFGKYQVRGTAYVYCLPNTDNVIPTGAAVHSHKLNLLYVKQLS